MKAATLLSIIFLLSFIIAWTWSYMLIKKNAFMHRRLDRKLRVFEFIRRTKLAIFNFFFMSAAAIIPVFVLGDAFLSSDILPIGQMVLGFIVILVVDDIWFYIIHRIMHAVPFLYKKIHIVHHKAAPPIPLDYLFTHPIEAIGASLGIFIGFLCSVWILGQANVYLLCLYTIYRTMHELCIHSGIRILPKKWLGWIGSSTHHYNHHKRLTGNYASGLIILDKLFGTELKN